MPAFAVLVAIGLTMFLVLSSFVVSLVLRFLEIEDKTVQDVCAVRHRSRR